MKFVEKNAEDAGAARLQPHGVDGARLARIGQLEIAGLQVLDRPRLRVGHDHIEA